MTRKKGCTPQYLPTITETLVAETKARLTLGEMEALEQEALTAATGRAAGADGAAEARTFSPSSVTRGEHVPMVELVLVGNKVLQVMKRTGPDGGQAFIDWINFTVHEDTAHYVGYPGSTLTDGDVVKAMSFALHEIFGFGVTGQYDRGRNFYKRSYPLGEEGYGFVGHGGQRNSFLVSVSGSGLAAAKPGWEYRLRAWLEGIAVNPKITRVDVAHDCYNGEYTPLQAYHDYDAGLYRLSKSPVDPEWEGRGNWKKKDLPGGAPKGLTAYVGLRTSGKFLRVYEKGKQLGSSESKWVRVECEFKSSDRVIPYDVLTAPGAYLAGAYPALNWISEQQDRIRTVRETAVVSKERKERYITRQCGADLHVLMELEEGATPQEQAFNLINRLKDETRLPKWAKLPDYRFSPAGIHESSMAACLSEQDVMSRLETMEI